MFIPIGSLWQPAVERLLLGDLKALLAFVGELRPERLLTTGDRGEELAFDAIDIDPPKLGRINRSAQQPSAYVGIPHRIHLAVERAASINPSIGGLTHGRQVEGRQTRVRSNLSRQGGKEIRAYLLEEILDKGAVTRDADLQPR